MTDRAVTHRATEETRRLFDGWAATDEADLLHADGPLHGYRRNLGPARTARCPMAVIAHRSAKNRLL